MCMIMFDYMHKSLAGVHSCVFTHAIQRCRPLVVQDCTWDGLPGESWRNRPSISGYNMFNQEMVSFKSWLLSVSVSYRCTISTWMYLILTWCTCWFLEYLMSQIIQLVYRDGNSFQVETLDHIGHCWTNWSIHESGPTMTLASPWVMPCVMPSELQGTFWARKVSLIGWPRCSCLLNLRHFFH